MNLELRLIELRGKEIMLKERGIWLCWPIIMRDKNPVAGCFHIGIKIGVFKDYCEKNLLNSYCISEILTVFSKIPDSCRLIPIWADLTHQPNVTVIKSHDFVIITNLDINYIIRIRNVIL